MKKVLMKIAIICIVIILFAGCSEDPKDPRYLVADLYYDLGDDFDLEIRNSSNEVVAESNNTGTHDQASCWIEPDDYVKIYVEAYSGSGDFDLYISGDYEETYSDYLSYGQTKYLRVDY